MGGPISSIGISWKSVQNSPLYRFLYINNYPASFFLGRAAGNWRDQHEICGRTTDCHRDITRRRKWVNLPCVPTFDGAFKFMLHRNSWWVTSRSCISRSPGLKAEQCKKYQLYQEILRTSCAEFNFLQKSQWMHIFIYPKSKIFPF